MSMLLDAAGLKSTDDVLKSVSTALRGDRKALRKLTLDTKGRLKDAAKKRIDQQLAATAKQLSGAQSKTSDARTTNGADSLPIRGARGVRSSSVEGGLGMRTPRGRMMRLRSGPIDRSELQKLARIIDRNSDHSDDAIRHNARSIDALAMRQEKIIATQREMAQLIAELQARGDLPLMQGLLSQIGDININVGKCKKDVKETRRVMNLKVKQLKSNMKAMQAAARVQVVSTAATSMQTAAFGVKGNLLDRQNLSVAGGHVLWSLLPDILKGLGLGSIAGDDPVRWLGPIAGLVTSQVALGNQQNQRFVSGIAEEADFTIVSLFFPETAEAVISLEPYIASGYWDEFRARTDVPVTVTPVSVQVETILQASVVDGVLTIRASNALGGSGGPSFISGMRIAWMIDTGQG